MSKYSRSGDFDYPSRTWPSTPVQKAPIWCSVDLRDGNQALANPMSPAQKMEYFRLLAGIGFKEIEISFPSASQTDYEFTRELIDNNHIPDDCTIQILTQAREHLIRKSFDALRGCKRAIFHMYNSTSPAQRDIVFHKSTKEIVNIAVDGVKMIRDIASKFDDTIILEYSPESFSQTEVPFAIDICNAVIDAWSPGKGEKVIINLPSTVEITSPNTYADQIEYVGKNLICRDRVIMSVHTHNDRGCAVAAAELAMMAGAQRVEGTLFGNGERTGNTDLITLILNLYSRGIDPGITITDIASVRETYERCTAMTVHDRHPYAGDLVFTAFSGSHQDAISKGLAAYKHSGAQWNVPYLPIDPNDIGRTYDAIIRINSQSGKGGAAFIMDSVFGFQIPKEMHPEFGETVKRYADRMGRELTQTEIHKCFFDEFINNESPYRIQSFCMIPSSVQDSDMRTVTISAEIVKDGKANNIEGKGNGILDALTHALIHSGASFSISSYHEHSISSGSDAKAVAYIAIEDKSGKKFFGAGIDTDIAFASFKALVSGVNRMNRGE